MSAFTLTAEAQTWPLAEPFVISRGVKTDAHVVVVTAARDGGVGRGECVPYARYGETVESVLDQIRSIPPIQSRAELQRAMPAGAARNAIDCALFDLEAKIIGWSAAEIADVAPLKAVPTLYTISLATPAEMAAKAASVPNLKLLKLKLGGAGDAERMAAVRKARPDAVLVADPNEAWTPDMLPALMQHAAKARIALIEQPLPAEHDAALARITRLVPICADESAHTTADLAALKDRYDAVNIKLDKTGGLTEALVMAEEARRLDFKIMVGSMVATSLSTAPALLVAQHADFADLDGPLLLQRDRADGLVIRNGIIELPSPQLWG
jgi:L-Ala-D/L-Glu epimerase